MKHFTFKQCALALCLGLASFLPGQSIATNAPDVSHPIGMELTEQEESGYAFTSASDDAECIAVFESGNGYNETKNKTITLQLPSSEADAVWFKIYLKDPSQANNFHFRLDNQDVETTDNILWISPDTYNKYDYQEGTFQSIPLGARITAPGSYTYVVEAHKNKEDNDIVASFETTFYLIINRPEVIRKDTVFVNHYDVEICPNDLAGQPLYITVSLVDIKGFSSVDFQSEGFTPHATEPNCWVSQPQSIETTKTIPLNFTLNGQGTAMCEIGFGVNENSGFMNSRIPLVYPFVAAESDYKVLEQLAEVNSSSYPEFGDYLKGDQWKKNFDPNSHFQIKWEKTVSSHVTYFGISHQNGTTPLSIDLNGFEHLEKFDFSNNTAPATINLSKLTQLEVVWLTNCALSYSDILLPSGFDKSNVRGISRIYNIGTPRGDEDVEIPMNTVINLANYVGNPIEGNEITYSWQKNWQAIELTPVEGTTGSFKLTGNVGDQFRCEIKSSLFTDWSIWTPTIYLTQGEMIFDAGDVAGLRKLASENSLTPYLQALFQGDDWKNTGNDEIKLKWSIDENQNARLTKIQIWPSNETEQNALKTLDLTAFTALQTLELHSLEHVESIDLSGCSALSEANIVIYDGKLTTLTVSNSLLTDLWLSIPSLQSLNLSNCGALQTLSLSDMSHIQAIDLSTAVNLKTLYINHIYLTSLNLSKLENLDCLDINGDDSIESLDLSALTRLKRFSIGSCPALKRITGLEKLVSLEELAVGHMDGSLSESLQKVNFSTLKGLDYSYSDLTLPDLSKLQNLKSLTLPKSISSLDLASLPNLESLSAHGSSFRYSQLENYRPTVKCDGTSYIELPGAIEQPEEELRYIVVDNTIDLTSEAGWAGQPTHYVWFDLDSWKEETDLFVEDANTPGLFTIDPNVPINQSGKYECRIWNEAVAKKVSWGLSGWVMYTERFRVVKKEPYNADEVAMLQTIVEQSKSDELKDWWNSDQWKNSGVDYSFEKGKVSVTWNDDKRLTKLKLTSFGDLLTGTLNLSAATELEELSFYLTEVEGCIFPENPKLQELDLYGSKVALPTNVKFPTLFYLYLSDVQDSLDLAQLPALSRMQVYGKPTLKYSAIQNPRKVFIYGNSLWKDSTWTSPVKQYNYHGITNFIKAAEAKTVNFSSETKAGATVTWEKQIKDLDYETINLTPDKNGAYDYSAALADHKSIRAKLTHPNYAQWYIYFNAMLYTEPGDANIDYDVNVLDIAATLPYVLKDYNNQLPIFGYYQADLDHNEKIEVADVVAIVNRIKDNATSSTESAASSFRSAFVPKVYVTSEADGKLYVETQVPLAGLQLTFTGVEQEIPLLGEAARFAHAAHASDSLRMVAYSMDASTIPAGRTLLAQLPKGATLVEALFADASAQSLHAELRGIVTATEEIWGDMAAEQVANYPNPFQGQTTFTYGVEGQADQAVIRIYATNGALVRVLNDLPVALGENQYRATIDLPAGLYLYRLEISRAGRVISTQTNNLIIK